MAKTPFLYGLTKFASLQMSARYWHLWSHFIFKCRYQYLHFKCTLSYSYFKRSFLHQMLSWLYSDLHHERLAPFGGKFVSVQGEILAWRLETDCSAHWPIGTWLHCSVSKYTYKLVTHKSRQYNKILKASHSHVFKQPILQFNSHWNKKSNQKWLVSRFATELQTVTGS